MDKEIKKVWVEALRSGEYKQGFRMLNNLGEDGGYCCLGVLCELYRKTPAGKDLKATPQMTHTTKRMKYGESDEEIYLPIEVMRWADLEEKNPSVGGISLADLNDGSGIAEYEHTFKEIASIIETLL